MSYWIVGDRQSGKTTAALKWFMRGGPVDFSPGWSRVFVMSQGGFMRGYVEDLLGSLWLAEEREGKPPFDALFAPTEIFSAMRGRPRNATLKYAIDEYDSVLRRNFPNYLEVMAQINVEVFTVDSYPLGEELTPSKFISLLDSTPTEETA